MGEVNQTVGLTLYHTTRLLTTRKKTLENTVGKGENAGNLFRVFYSIKEKNIILETLNLSSANAFNLVTSKILSFGKGLNVKKGYLRKAVTVIYLYCLKAPLHHKNIIFSNATSSFSRFIAQSVTWKEYCLEYWLTLSQTSPGFMCLQYKSFENTVGKGEIAHHEQFLLFPKSFLSIRKTF